MSIGVLYQGAMREAFIDQGPDGFMGGCPPDGANSPATRKSMGERVERHRHSRSGASTKRKARDVNEILAQALHSMDVSEPVSHGLLHIFPLRGGTPEEGNLSLLEDGLRAGTLRVEEQHDGSCAPELRIVNEGDSRVLILEGDELIGAGRHRVANSSVLVNAGYGKSAPYAEAAYDQVRALLPQER
jgi:hypothetical protein